ncbi:hypothetical protein AAC387_Pa12g0651 [Persea americana]
MRGEKQRRSVAAAVEKQRPVAVALKKNGEEEEETVYMAPVCVAGTWAPGETLARLRWTENGEEGDGDREETIPFRDRRKGFFIANVKGYFRLNQMLDRNGMAIPLPFQ